jgi:hypothetical protein
MSTPKGRDNTYEIRLRESLHKRVRAWVYGKYPSVSDFEYRRLLMGRLVILDDKSQKASARVDNLLRLSRMTTESIVLVLSMNQR